MLQTFPIPETDWHKLNAQQPFGVPSFERPLVTSIAEGFNLGSGTPTYTRASTAYATDFEGRLVLVPSGATRMQGARIVRNLLAYSEDLTNANWLKNLATPASAQSITFAADAAEYAVQQPVFSQINTFVMSHRLSTNSGTKTIRIQIGFGGVGATITGNLTVTTTPTWFSFLRVGTVAGTGTLTVGLLNGSDATAGTINVLGSQLEVVTGQSNTTFGDYVNTNVLSAPYHGLDVDGIKAYDTLNANSVASNIVTEVAGARIDSGQAAAAGGVTAGVVDASGPLGYLSESAATNYILQSNTLNTTWTISNAADMNAVNANAYISRDGSQTMDLIQPKATTAVHSLDQAFTFTAAKYTTAVDLRYVAATPQRWVALILNDGTTTWGASFDLLNGVVGAVSAGATSTIKATGLTSVYRVSVTNTANAAAAAGTVKISLNATDTATLENAARAGTETLGAGMVQHEIGTFASSPITTTTVAVTRAADVEQNVSAGNVPTNDFVVYGESAFPVVPTAASYYLWASYVDADNSTSVLWDGTNLIGRKRISGTSHDATIALAPTAGTVFKWAARFTSTTGTDIFLNGTKGTNDATNTACQIGTNFQTGADGNGVNQPNATTRTERVRPRALSNAHLTRLTT